MRSNFRVAREKGDKVARRSQTREHFVNFKNATNVSAADSVARGASIYMQPRAKLGDRREREVEAGPRAFDWILTGGEKKFQFRRRVLWGATRRCHTWRDRIPHRSEILDGIAGHKSASGVGANYGSLLPWGKKQSYVRRREHARRILWINLRPCTREIRLFRLWR